jgi:hypothetical protein
LLSCLPYAFKSHMLSNKTSRSKFKGSLMNNPHKQSIINSPIYVAH